MLNIELSEKEIEDMNEAIDSPDTKQKLRRRLLAVKMAAGGVRRDLICSTLDISAPSLCSYIKLYQEGKLAALLENRSYGPASSAMEHEDRIRELFESEPPSSAAQAQSMIESNFSLTLSAHQTRRCSRILSRACSSPGSSRPAEARLGSSSATRATSCGAPSPATAGASSGFGRARRADGSATAPWGRWTRSARISTLWIRTDRSTRRPSAPFFWISGSLTPKIPSAWFWTTLATTTRIVKELARGLGVELLYLPAYSPNLYAIERLWKWVKPACLENRYHESFKGFRACIKETLESQADGFSEDLKTLLTLNFQKLKF